MSGYLSIQLQLDALSDDRKAEIFRWFFKTGPGEYGEGDIFIGVTVPLVRKVVKEHYKTVSLSDTVKLLRSPVHEHRLCALLILTEKAERAAPDELEKIYDLYLANTKFVNNWDLVDSSAHKIVGRYLEGRPEKRVVLDALADSQLLWDQRIAVIATFWFIKRDDYADNLRLAEKLLQHPHDLMHKAVGWMLREIGKRDRRVEEEFLVLHYKKMPRTMLRYAIEKFDEPTRQAYLKATL